MKYFFLLLIIGCSAHSQVFVTKVHDGDTFYTSDHKIIRLAEVDCPELLQDYGDQAKNFTEMWILHKRVTLVKTSTDKYGRDICQVYVNGNWVNKMLVENGLAWAYKNRSEFYDLELQVRSKRIGMWSGHPTPPFLFRR